MTATAYRDSDTSTKAVSEVLSEDAGERKVELAFLERMVSLTASKSAARLSAARAHKLTGLESDVLEELHDFRNPMWTRLARELEKTHLPQADFGEFGKYREGDR
jgi:hypothetical protein